MRTSMSDGMPYVDFCRKVMEDETGELLKNFRRHPDYAIVVPSNPDGSGVMEFLDILKREHPYILERMSYFAENQGTFGNPNIHDFGEDIGVLDSVLILYIYYFALTVQYFGFDGITSICEIGPGAGLFFKVFTDIFDTVKYTFVDLEGPLFINRKHVEYLGREHLVANYFSCEQVCIDGTFKHEYDLLVSDCAFNELHRDVQEIYIERLLNNSVRGRIAFYDVDINAVLPSMNIFEVFKKLNRKSKIIKMDLRVPTLYWDESREV